MACTDGRTKIWPKSTAGSVFTQTVTGDEDGGFTAVASVFEGNEEPRIVKLHPGKPLSLKMKAKTDYFVITQVVIVTVDPIDVQVSSTLDGKTHCTTITGKDTTTKNVQHTILVS